MVDSLLQLVVAPTLVGASTLAARRWGERTGGLVSAFPAIVGPVLFIAAREHGPAFAARAASGTLLGLVALSGFALACGWAAALRAGWLVSLAAGWVVAAGIAPSSPGSRRVRSSGWPRPRCRCSSPNARCRAAPTRSVAARRPRGTCRCGWR
jgi:hypothetical protein